MCCKLFGNEFSVDIYLLIFNLGTISRLSDYPLDEIFFFIFRKLKDYNVTVSRFVKWYQYPVCKWYLYPVDEFIHQYVIANLKCWNHGTGWYLECLHNKCLDNKGHNYSN